MSRTEIELKHAFGPNVKTHIDFEKMVFDVKAHEEFRGITKKLFLRNLNAGDIDSCVVRAFNLLGTSDNINDFVKLYEIKE